MYMFMYMCSIFASFLNYAFLYSCFSTIQKKSVVFLSPALEFGLQQKPNMLISIKQT